MRTTAFVLAMSAGAAALAGEVICPDCTELTIGAESTAEVSVFFDTFLGSDSPEPQTVGVTGTIVLERIDEPESRGIVFESRFRIHGIDINLVPSASFDGSADFDSEFGFADYSFGLESMRYSGPPIPNDSDDKDKASGLSIDFSNIPLELVGTHAVDYDIVGIGVFSQPTEALPGNPREASLNNLSYNSADGTVTITGTLDVSPFVIEYEPGLVELQVQSINLSLIAEGDEPNTESCCSLADIAEPYGLLDLADIVAFATAFSDMTEAGDIDDNGLFDLADITGFITLFGEGCKDTSPAYCYFSDENYAGIQFHTGNPAYAMGEHRTMTAGLALGGAALMLGFAAFRRRGS